MLRRLLLAVAGCFALSSFPAVADNVLIVVDLELQSMQVSVDGIARHRWDVSSGAVGFETPTGRYKPTRMYRTYHSRTYENAPMPHSIFFFQGYAIHGTTDLDNLGSMASHGCVRLHPDNAEALFALVKQAGPRHTTIRIRQESAWSMVAMRSEPAAIAEETPAVMRASTPVDVLTTGSTATAASIPWISRGVRS